MRLDQLLEDIGFSDGVALRYNSDCDLVIFCLNLNGNNPAVVQMGAMISVGTIVWPGFGGEIVDDRSRNPIDRRMDFDLADPESLTMIESRLNMMFDRCNKPGRKGKRKKLNKFS